MTLINVLAVTAASWAVLMALAPLLQVRRMVQRRSSADVSLVTVAVVREQGGVRRVVPHHAKHTRGLFAGQLLTRPALPGDADGLAAAAAELGAVRDVELTAPDRGGRRTLTLLLAT